jgi:hypothetical protein
VYYKYRYEMKRRRLSFFDTMALSEEKGNISLRYERGDETQ